MISKLDINHDMMYSQSKSTERRTPFMEKSLQIFEWCSDQIDWALLKTQVVKMLEQIMIASMSEER